MSKIATIKIAPCLWFTDEAEEAAAFYMSIFKKSRILNVTRYGKERHPIKGIQEGQVMTIKFELDEQEFVALNGGSPFKFNEAISFMIHCETQEEIDYYWDRLSEGGDESAQVCGWLKDRYGVSWQVVPSGLSEMLSDQDPARTERVTRAMLQMKKMDLHALQAAYEGTHTYPLTVTRVFPVSVHQLWEAWTNSDLVKRWWGPSGFTCPVADLDFREGGSSLVCMRAPREFGGQDFYNTWTYTKIVPQHKIEYILRFTDAEGKPFNPADAGMPQGVPKEVPHSVTFNTLDNGDTELTIVEYGYTPPQARDLSKPRWRFLLIIIFSIPSSFGSLPFYRSTNDPSVAGISLAPESF